MDVVRTKLFRNGGSVAVRIPAGWLDPSKEVALTRDVRTGRIYLGQEGTIDPQSFFEFLRGGEFLPDSELGDVLRQSDSPRPFPGESGQ